MLSALTPHVSKLKYLVGENSSAILTGVGIAGTVGTAVLTGRAGFKAGQIIQEAEENVLREQVGQIIDIRETPEGIEATGEVNLDRINALHLTTTDKIKMVWPLFLPPVALGTVTIASIFAAHRMDSKKIAALAMATGVSERALSEYKEKVQEKLGDNSVRKVQDAIAEDAIEKNPVSGQTVIVGGGDVLCFDLYSGRYFNSSVDQIKKAELAVMENIVRYNDCSLGHFYDELGLPQTSQSGLIGWNLDNKIEIVYSTQTAEDGRPCITIDFKKPPIHNYDKWGFTGD